MYITVRTTWFLDFAHCVGQGCRNCFLKIALWTEFVWWRLIFVFWYEAGFMSLFCGLEF